MLPHSSLQPQKQQQQTHTKLQQLQNYTMFHLSYLTYADSIFTTNHCMFDVFKPDHQTFGSLFKIRRHVIGYINHDTIVGLCFEVFMRLYYHIHL